VGGGPERRIVSAIDLDAELEDQVRFYSDWRRKGDGSCPFDDEKVDALSRSLRRSLRAAGSSVRLALLTSAELRPYLRELVAAEFPALRVLAHEELPSIADVQLIGRATIDEAA
jgi:type III secretory pathway component EscV